MSQFPDRLRQAPDQIEVVSAEGSAGMASSGASGGFAAYPERGVLPAIDGSGLDFLHADIQRACLCVGSLVEGRMRARWLGRQALENGELWSCTKLIPLLQVVDEVEWAISRCRSGCGPGAPSGNEGGPDGGGMAFNALAVDMFSYEKTIGSSNAIAAMFKQFSTPSALEEWLQQITGNTGLTFRGRYGEAPFIVLPSAMGRQGRPRAAPLLRLQP